jgi:hypothetical protein
MNELNPSGSKMDVPSAVAGNLDASFGCQEMDTSESESPTQTPDESPTQTPVESTIQTPANPPTQTHNESPAQKMLVGTPTQTAPKPTESGSSLAAIGKGCLVLGGLGLVAWYSYKNRETIRDFVKKTTETIRERMSGDRKSS